LDARRKEVRQKYQENVTIYVREMLGRPLEKIHVNFLKNFKRGKIFFIRELRNCGVKENVGNLAFVYNLKICVILVLCILRQINDNLSHKLKGHLSLPN